MLGSGAPNPCKCVQASWTMVMRACCVRACVREMLWNCAKTKAVA